MKWRFLIPICFFWTVISGLLLNGCANLEDTAGIAADEHDSTAPLPQPKREAVAAQDSGVQPPKQALEIHYTGYVLGPLAGAKVEMFPLSRLEKAPVYTTHTSASTVLSQAGAFTIPASKLHSDQLYLIKVSGGELVELEKHGGEDFLPRTNKGSIHALVSGAQIKGGNCRVSVVTEMVYQRLFFMLAADYPRQAIEDEIASQASELLNRDVDGDGFINASDLLSWDPGQHQDSLRYDLQAYQELLAAIYHGEAPMIRRAPLTHGVIAHVEMPGSSFGVAARGHYVYVADSSAGLQIVDATDPATPVINGVVTTPGNAFGVAVTDDHAYVADSFSGIQIVDISDAEDANIVAVVDTPGDASGVAVVDNLLYVAEGSEGIQIIDISDPGAPDIRAGVDTPGIAYGLTVDKGMVYVADGSKGLRIIDVALHAALPVVGVIDTPGSAFSVEVLDGLAYVADGTGGLRIIDVHDPASPTPIGAVDTPGFARGVAVYGDYAYVADGKSGLQIIDIRDPSAPRLLWTLSPPQFARHVYLNRDYVFVADSMFGLQVLRAVTRTVP